VPINGRNLHNHFGLFFGSVYADYDRSKSASSSHHHTFGRIHGTDENKIKKSEH
jgi:hypothetical protein